MKKNFEEEKHAIGLRRTGHFNFKTDLTWRIFRIMAEFVEGFEFLSNFKKTVSIFGSTRFTEKNHYYKEARLLGKRLSDSGFTVITGGGPGMMEAANRGASEGKGQSVGINIQLPHEQKSNKYVQSGMGFYYFFTRKVMLSASSQAYVFFPGGYGTLDELLELLVLIQTKKVDPIPIILYGKGYWTPFVKFLEEQAYEKYDAIDKKDLKIFTVVDTVSAAYKIVKKSRPRKYF